ncbi:N-6 DNA methylase [uncultured Methanofollis sp.]|uniref:N-6 DNA methylase n=1 Tax=uncultured Methanofollis sp. TaxID=262500 RepID=UPI0026387E17|nr:N-6 DNA methylase [uncultured Methanofollis sp.]
MTNPRSLSGDLLQVRSILRADPATAHSSIILTALLALKMVADQRAEWEEATENHRRPLPIMMIEREYHAQGLPGFLPYAPLWDEIRTAESPGNALNAAFARLEQAHPGKERWFDALDFDTGLDKLWTEVVEKISALSFRDADARNRMQLRFQVYGGIRNEIWRSRVFAVPPILARLLVRLLAPADGTSVFDPFCQDGMVLREVVRYARKNRESGVTLYAQTPNDHSRLVTALNLLVHNCPDVHIATGDPILTPGFVQDDRRLGEFDRVVGTVPAGAMDWGSEVLQHDPYVRFVYGVPPRTSRDFAYLSHAIASLADGGRLVAVVPAGILFRSARTEKEIRANIINKDRVEAVIALPPRIFPSTAAEYAVLVIAAGKAAERQGRTAFIDATGLFLAGRGRNILRDEDTARVLDAYTSFKEIEGFSAVATTDEIAENDFTLEVSRYVLPVEEKVEKIDLDATFADLEEVRRKKAEALDRFLASVARLKDTQR